jgi:carboxymethylenebutenolidase
MHEDFPQADIDSLLPRTAFDRRAFLVSAAASGIALAARPVAAQTMIVTPMDGLDGGDIEVPSFDRAIPAYVAMPKHAGPFPVVLVCQEIFGVHEHIKDICRRLAHSGYFAIAPEIYVRQGDPKLYTDVPTLLKELVSKVPDEQVMKDFDACVAYAAGHRKADAKRIGITGFCYGGRIVWLYCAHSNRVKAGVAWYGRLVGTETPLTPKHPVDIADQLQAPILGLYGGADQGIPLDTVERMRAALRAFGKGHQSIIHVYDRAPHAFNADYRPSYRKEAAEDGWKRMLAWFKQHGV